MVESIGRESYFPIINCASWSVFLYHLPDRGQTKVDGRDHACAGRE